MHVYSSLENVADGLSVHIYDIQEYVTSIANEQQRKRQTQTLQLTRCNYNFVLLHIYNY